MNLVNEKICKDPGLGTGMWDQINRYRNDYHEDVRAGITYLLTTPYTFIIDEIIVLEREIYLT